MTGFEKRENLVYGLHYILPDRHLLLVPDIKALQSSMALAEISSVEPLFSPKPMPCANRFPGGLAGFAEPGKAFFEILGLLVSDSANIEESDLHHGLSPSL